RQIAKLGNTAKLLLANPRLGWIIFYGRDDRIMQFLSSSVAAIFKARFRFFYSQEEAFAFLNSVDQELPDLSKYLTT
ncbi:MAG: hypothetical protein KC708_15205, partial [Anaerolineae bacterium]|nr:hypothetical protein [Anaerolineae bacterium]